VSSIQGINALIKRLNALGDTAPDMRALQIATISEAQAHVHRRTGFLQRNIIPGEVTKDSATIRAATPYAATVEFGSKPHIIKPKNARVLAWGGERRLTGRLRSGAKATHFATLVHHPGTKAYPYLIPAAKKAAGMLQEILVKRWNDAG
jgi:hypothetical protein